MQSVKDDEIIETRTGEIDALLGRVRELSQELRGNVHHTIANLPNEGDELTINGLVWVVQRVNGQRGWMRLTLKRPS